MIMDNLPDIITCPNCGHRYTGNYCPNCGQSTRELNRPFGEMFKELMDTLFEFDTRFVRSIKPLLLKPGFLPAEYVAGRRATYYPPFKLVIFISIILFALLEISSTDMISAGILNDVITYNILSSRSIFTVLLFLLFCWWSLCRSFSMGLCKKWWDF